MRIPCPFCGERESSEFTYLGDASPRRPTYAAESAELPAGTEAAFFDYVYLRDNVAGPMHELWYHGGGCRSWLVAHRNTVTHEILSVEPAPGAGAAVSEGAN
ncbi:MAG: sarcosine oxidase subunit delta [Mesorhizobium amorphae]|nr:MAG: sarcosine oxidase subunit delta [Mesorhizobium amorphae]